MLYPSPSTVQSIRCSCVKHADLNSRAVHFSHKSCNDGQAGVWWLPGERYVSDCSVHIDMVERLWCGRTRLESSPQSDRTPLGQIRVETASQALHQCLTYKRASGRRSRIYGSLFLPVKKKNVSITRNLELPLPVSNLHECHFLVTGKDMARSKPERNKLAPARVRSLIVTPRDSANNTRLSSCVKPGWK